MDERLLALAVLGVIMVVLGLAGSGDESEVQSQASVYCDMVSINKQSHGENGWPDYKGIYEEACR